MQGRFRRSYGLAQFGKSWPRFDRRRLSAPGCDVVDLGYRPVTAIRGILFAGRFLTHGQLLGMAPEQQRNALINIMAAHSNESISHFQSLNDNDLAGVGAVMVVLLVGGSRTPDQLRTISSDNQRNTLISELASQGLSGSTLQGMGNQQVALVACGGMMPGAISHAALVQGVLLLGQFRTFAQLRTMSSEDRRNTLIVELSKHSNASGPALQGLDDFQLSGAGAAMVFLRINRIRDDLALKTMSLDDQRNTTIVEVDRQLHVGNKLQGLPTFDVITAALGIAPKFFVPLPPITQGLRLFRFSVDSLNILEQKSDNEHSDSDWLSIIISIGNAATKADPRTLPPTVINIERNIKTGNTIAGIFKSDPFDIQETDVVFVSLLVTNLGSSRIEDQGRQAVQITNKVVDIASPIIGAAIGLFFGNPLEGAQIGKQVGDGIDKGVSVLSDVFDFLGVHFGPPNCNGVVLRETLTYLPGEMQQAVGVGASREITGTQENDRCGSPPRTQINFHVLQQPTGSGDPNF